MREDPLADRLAYVLYTSGSTGKPKGVMVSHRALAPYVAWAAAAYGAGRGRGAPLASSLGFDLTVTSLFPPLVAGTTVRTVSEEEGLDGFAQALAEEPDLSLVKLTPAHLEVLAPRFAAGRWPGAPGAFVIGGEALLGATLAPWWRAAPASALINEYGPTETVVGCAIFDAAGETLASLEASGGAVPIGRAIAAARLYVLDRGLRPVAAGAPGELFIGGTSVARGYQGLPARTAASFRPDPFAAAPGARLYASGDLVRQRADGQLLFLGRRDRQVKLRGFRIELAEIEAALGLHPAVAQAAVLLREDVAGDPRLVAYWVPAAGAAGPEEGGPKEDGSAPSVAELRAHLAARLPPAMVPSAFVPLAALPLTVNGKLDRGALPSPESASRGGAGEADEGDDWAFVGPGLSGGIGPSGGASPVEAELLRIWEEVLRRRPTSLEDDFFALGGHSLLAMKLVSRVRAALGVELPLRAVFATPRLADLAREIDRLERSSEPALVQVDRQGPLPLSFAQERLWFLHQFEPRSTAYHVPFALRLAGELDRRAFARALVELVRRHEVLRTRYVAVDGEARQVVAPAGGAPWAVVDLAGLPEETRAMLLQRLRRRETARPFDLGGGRVLRVTLVALGAEEHAVLATMHHIASDGWSLGVLVRELSALYSAFRAGAPSPLPELAWQYADYAVWQRRWLSGAVLASKLAVWRERLAGVPALLELPTDRPRPATASHRGGARAVALPPAVSAAAHGLAREHGATPFMVLLAGFQAFLGRLAGSRDVAVGTPVAGRTHLEIEGLIGFFVNTLVLRADLDGDPSFGELVERVRRVALEAHGHQEVPFERLVEELAPERSLAHSPLFQVMFTLQSAQEGAGAQLAGLRAEPLPSSDSRKVAGDSRKVAGGGREVAGGSEKFDLSLTLAESAAGVRGLWSYASDLFDATTAERMARQWAALVARAVAEPALRLSQLGLASAAEMHQVRLEWGGAAPAFPAPGSPASVGAAFAARAGSEPEAVAVVAGGEHLSFGALHARARGEAARLAGLGVGPESRVGLCGERSPELVAGILGILLAGGAYVPLDPELPEERLAGMVADAEVAWVLGDPQFAARLPAGAAELLPWAEPSPRAAAPLPEVPPEALAYVLFTSGTTGRPKGTMIRHAALVHHLGWLAETLAWRADDRLVQRTPLFFDASVWEVFLPLTAGGRLVLLPPGGHREVGLLLRTVAEERVTVLQAVPSLLAVIAEHASWPRATSLRWVASGGEALSADLAARLFVSGDGRRVINLYGPTETTVQVATAVVAARSLVRGDRWPGGATVPIGRPGAGVDLSVLDPRGGELPIGLPGELWIGGLQVARGYLGRPGMTAERFVPLAGAEESGARGYRSGDRVRWLADGQLEYLGRLDQQVKLRGLRIELGEIEAVLAAHPRVRQAVAVVRLDRPGLPQLVAYWVPEPGAAPSSESLAELLCRKLPAAMQPQALIELAELPLAPSGKVDRRALPAPAAVEAARAGSPGGAALGSTTGAEPGPATGAPVEEVLAGIWAGLLGREGAGHDSVGRDEDFFALGGHSLLVIRMLARVERAFGVELPVQAAFEASTVRTLARRVEAALAAGLPPLPPLVPVPRDRPLPLSFAQRRLWFLDRLEPGRSTYNIPAALGIDGGLAVAALARALAALVARHESLRTRLPVVDGEPVQVIAPPPRRLALPVVDLSALPPAAGGRLARHLTAAEARRPFDLAAGPLRRERLLRLAGGGHGLLLTLHHAIADGWSMDVLFRELLALYRTAAAGGEAALPELPVQYADYAVWQRGWLRDEVIALQTDFWRRDLAGLHELLALPTDRPRPPVAGARAGYRRLTLGAEDTRRLRQVARQESATVFMALLAGLQALLFRAAGVRDLTIGVPVAGRRRAELEGLIGFFVNTLVLRSELVPRQTLGELLAAVRQRLLAAASHQDLPFEKLVEELSPARSLAHSPLFQVMLSHQVALAPHQPEASRLPGGAEPSGESGGERGAGGGAGSSPLALRPWRGAPAAAKFDLSFNWEETADGLRGGVVYRTDLFDATTVERWCRQLERLLATLASAPATEVLTASVLTPAEAHQLRREWALPPGLALPVASLSRALRETAARQPDTLAVEASGEHLSWAGLDRRVEALAAALAARGVGPEVRVGLALARSPEMVIGLLAILRAGGAYVPLDLAAPAERLAQVRGDAGLAAVLVTAPSALLGDVPQMGVPDGLDADAGPALPEEDPAALADRLAYVLYTSGSTGRPKGVMVSVRALSAYVGWAVAAYRAAAGRGALVSTPLAFDLTVTSLHVPLAAGSPVRLVPDEDGIDGLAAKLALEPDLGLLNLTPAHLELLAPRFARPASPWRGAPACFVIGGEALLGSALAPWRAVVPGSALMNEYGPTETVVGCATFDATREEPAAGTVPIGRPAARARLFVLDRELRLAPAGTPGELFIGGPGVARGYLAQPGLTAASFRPDPFAGEPGARLYASGDVVRQRGDGQLLYLGRRDQQVKLRGVRLELGEIEAALRAHPAVRQAVVELREERREGLPGDGRLVAYWVAAEPGDGSTPGAELAGALREHLATKLPAVAVPSTFVLLPALPLTPNGKVDRRALPAPGLPGGHDDGESHAAPRDAHEAEVARIWQEVLGVPRVAIDEDFFALGGHSLLAVRLLHQLELRFGVELPLSVLFQAPTVAALAARLAVAGEPLPASPLVPITATGALPPLFCVHGVEGDVLGLRELARALGPEQPFFGLEAPADGPMGIEDLAALYLDALGTARPAGEGVLAGWSFGCAVAFEMAQRLRAGGAPVPLLVLLDGRPPAPSGPLAPATSLDRAATGDLQPDAEMVGFLLSQQASQLGTNLGVAPRDLAGLSRAEAVARLLAAARSRGFLAGGYEETALLRRAVAARRRILAAAEYRPRPYPGRVLFVRTEPADGAAGDPSGGWGALVTGPLEVHAFPGPHARLLRSPRVELVVEVLRRALAKLGS